MDWMDGEARRSLSTIREARVDGFVPRRREPVLCSAMGKNLAGTLLNGVRPRVPLKRKKRLSSREKRRRTAKTAGDQAQECQAFEVQTGRDEGPGKEDVL